MKVAIANLAPDPGQPRKEFPLPELNELADSIAAKGLLQPILIRKADKPGKFWVVAGERRWRAHRILVSRGTRGFTQIEANVREIKNEADLRGIQIVENIHRSEMRPMETADAYHDLATLRGSDKEAAREIRIPLARFRAKASLRGLEPASATLLRAGHLSEADAIEIARLPSHAEQTRVLRLLNSGKLGQWRSLRAAVDVILDGTTQADMFGASAPVASKEEVKTVSRMEAMIEETAARLAKGWRKGECIIANKVDPDRASHMADKLAAIRATVRRMEQELRAVNAQAQIVLEIAA